MIQGIHTFCLFCLVLHAYPMASTFLFFFFNGDVSFTTSSWILPRTLLLNRPTPCYVPPFLILLEFIEPGKSFHVFASFLLIRPELFEGQALILAQE